MSVLAIAMAPAVTTAHDLAGGALGPFKMSLLLTALNACLLFSWRRDSNKACPGCSDVARLGSHAWTAVLGGGNAALIIAAQGCFEAATFAFALLWTPLLAAFYVEMELPQPPWGIVFSQQLVRCPAFCSCGLAVDENCVLVPGGMVWYCVQECA